ncbi:HCLS1-associated protein X-1 isoform X1 [Takifugu rubripes]|uniref:HCLS1-associated protein X-1 isoform X1 n=2 Tax=Takifugu rubripes TaxID=31033 RepID=UPI0011452A7C|nr:HCLS1-associated protein X-1 isoform X1 [Takifugu rubripes]
MSLFDLFRGFFGVPEGHYGNRRDPFFEAMTHDDDDDADEEDTFFDGFHRDQRGPSDDTRRFGSSVGPGAMRFHVPPEFGQIFREMEEIFSQFGHTGVPALPPHGDKREGPSGNPLRDFMLKSPDSDSQRPQRPSREPRHDAPPSEKSPVSPHSTLPGWRPFSQFDLWKKGPEMFPEDERRVDRDLDSAVSSGGLDQIMAPPAGQTPEQPKARSFFQSVTVTKVLKPDGSVEERRTVRDSRGKEETTVTVSGDQEQAFSHMRDDSSLFSKLFGGLK